MLQVMLVVVRGDPGLPGCEVLGLDILATRHPKLLDLIVHRMGFTLEENNVGTNCVHRYSHRDI